MSARLDHDSIQVRAQEQLPLDEVFPEAPTIADADLGDQSVDLRFSSSFRFGLGNAFQQYHLWFRPWGGCGICGHLGLLAYGSVCPFPLDVTHVPEEYGSLMRCLAISILVVTITHWVKDEENWFDDKNGSALCWFSILGMVLLLALQVFECCHVCWAPICHTVSHYAVPPPRLKIAGNWTEWRCSNAKWLLNIQGSTCTFESVVSACHCTRVTFGRAYTYMPYGIYVFSCLVV